MRQIQYGIVVLEYDISYHILHQQDFFWLFSNFNSVDTVASDNMVWLSVIIKGIKIITTNTVYIYILCYRTY